MENKFAERLTELLNEKGLSKREAARICNISAQSISDWSTGKIQPTAEMIYIICTKFNESADYILGIEDENGNRKPGQQYIFNIQNNYNK